MIDIQTGVVFAVGLKQEKQTVTSYSDKTRTSCFPPPPQVSPHQEKQSIVNLCKNGRQHLQSWKTMRNGFIGY